MVKDNIKKFDIIFDEEIAQIMTKIDDEFPMVYANLSEETKFVFAEKVDVEKLVRFILSIK